MGCTIAEDHCKHLLKQTSTSIKGQNRAGNIHMTFN